MPAPVVAASVLWITGLAGTGKSTLAATVAGALRAAGERPLLLDGDALRALFDGSGDRDRYSRDARLERAWRIARLARMAASQGIPTIVATISLFHCVQQWNRQGGVPYCEVLLTAPVAVLAARRPDLYGAESIERDVVGVSLEPEFPPTPDIVIEQTFELSRLAAHGDAVIARWRAIAPA